MAKIVANLPPGNYPELKFDRGLFELLPQHTREEKKVLYENIENDQVIRDPVCAWKKTDTDWIIVDGYTRFSTNKPVAVVLYEFRDRSEVMEWMVRNQCGRRNLSASARALLVMEYLPESSAKKIAAIANVSESTVKLARRRARMSGETLESLKNDAHEILDEIEDQLDCMEETQELMTDEERAKVVEHDKKERKKKKPVRMTISKMAEESNKLMQAYQSLNIPSEIGLSMVEALNVDVALQDLAQLSKTIRRMLQDENSVTQALRDEMILSRLAEMKDILMSNRPYNICPACVDSEFQNIEMCQACGGKGWINKRVSDIIDEAAQQTEKQDSADCMNE